MKMRFGAPILKISNEETSCGYRAAIVQDFGYANYIVGMIEKLADGSFWWTGETIEVGDHLERAENIYNELKAGCLYDGLVR